MVFCGADSISNIFKMVECQGQVILVKDIDKWQIFITLYRPLSGYESNKVYIV
jgi:hypothetical protein